MKNLLSFIAFFVISLMPVVLCAQPLFSVSQNDLSKENAIRLKTQIAQSEISTLSLTRNNEERNMYSVSLSSVENTKIIMMNEQTGSHIVITPVEETRAEFQLAPFFIQEMKQGVLGDAARYLIVETTTDFSVRNVTSVSASFEDTFIPRFFYGNKNDVKEALPKDRTIEHIFKQKPHLILASDEPELLNYAAQYEEAMSYYVYLYKLPDGTLCTYDEHFNPVSEENAVKVGGTRGQLEFVLTGNLNTTQKPPTEYALSLWSEKLIGSVPVKINVDFIYISNPNVIGQSYHMPMAQNTGQVPTSPTSTWYPSSLWHQLVGYPQISGLNIMLEMNSNFSFYFQTTGNPNSSQIDWITVMLHEVNHGLGFYPICQSNGIYYANSNTANPGIFDRQFYQGSTGDVRFTDLDQSQRAALLISNNLFAGAPDSYLFQAHNGKRVKMYAPTTYQGGSSGSHWNYSPGFTTFMTASISQGWKFHTITTREVGILKDLGWKDEVLELIFVSFNPNGGIGNMDDQQFPVGVEQYLKANTFTKTGYLFKNWNTEADGSGDTYNDKQVATFTEDIELFAQWEGEKFTLTFNPGSYGTVDTSEIQVTYEKPVGSLPVPVRPGHAFKGWRIEGTISNIDENYIWLFLVDKKANAIWEKVTIFHTITATATEGGTITPSGDTLIAAGNNLIYTITPDHDYFIVDVLVDDESVGSNSEYTFANITAPHTIHAIFNFLGIHDNLHAGDIRIFPNPTTGEFKVQVFKSSKVQGIEIFDIYGRILSSHHLINTSSHHKIDISHLQPGIYFIKITTETGQVVKKIIKQ